MIICKFGGTSVAVAGAIRRIADIVRGRPASGRWSSSRRWGHDERVAGGRRAGGGGSSVHGDHIVESLRDRHMAVIAELLGDDAEARDIAADESVLFDELAHLAEALSVLGHSRSARSMQSRRLGERLSTHRSSPRLLRAGVDAVWSTPRQVMVTDAAFGRAEPPPDAIARGAP